jgi:hypothetical protein
MVELFFFFMMVSLYYINVWIYYMLFPFFVQSVDNLISCGMMPQNSLPDFRIVLQVKAEDMDAYDPKNLLVVTTGSQVRLTS